MEETKLSYEQSYQNMIKYLKILYQDLTMLHHNVVGSHFLSVHQALNDMYDLVAGMTDDLVEAGMSIGIAEPSIEDSLKLKSTIPVALRTSEDTLKLAKDELSQAIVFMTEAKGDNIPDDIVNKIEEYQYDLRKWANYKIEAFLYA